MDLAIIHLAKVRGDAMQEGSDRRRIVAGSPANSTLPPNPLDKRWFVHVAEKTYGPYSGNDITRLAADGRITASDWVCPEGASAWIEAKNEPTLGSLFRPRASMPQPPSSGAAPIPAQEASSAKRKWKRFGFKPNALFQRADQESIREDLREFFGPRAEKYLAIYDKMRAANKSHAVSWNWAAFFATYTWFFYRKMYLFGVCLIVIQFAVSFVFGIYGMVAYAAALTVGGKSQYVLWAMKKLDEADARGLVGKERQDYLRRMGGVSVVAGIGREHW
jgi:GYF domain 2/Protein of unknown function (DUF2628)